MSLQLQTQTLDITSRLFYSQETSGTDTPFAYSATWHFQDPLVEGADVDPRISMNIVVTRSSDITRIDGTEEVWWGKTQYRRSSTGTTGLDGYVLQAVRRSSLSEDENA